MTEGQWQYSVTYDVVSVPVVDGVATLPDGSTIHVADGVTEFRYYVITSSFSWQEPEPREKVDWAREGF